MESNKSEVFSFSRLRGNKPPPLDLMLSSTLVFPPFVIGVGPIGLYKMPLTFISINPKQGLTLSPSMVFSFAQLFNQECVFFFFTPNQIGFRVQCMVPVLPRGVTLLLFVVQSSFPNRGLYVKPERCGSLSSSSPPHVAPCTPPPTFFKRTRIIMPFTFPPWPLPPGL